MTGTDRARSGPHGAPGAEAERLLCPLCGLRFEEGKDHCVACPMHSRCATICCPRCGYQFVERSVIAEWFHRVVRRLLRRPGAGNGHDAPTVEPPSRPGGAS